MSPHPTYFGKSRVLPDVSEDLGKEMDSRGVCLCVWRKLVACIFLVSVTLESYSPWVVSAMYASPQPWSLPSQASLLQAGGKKKIPSSQSSKHPFPKAGVSNTLLKAWGIKETKSEDSLKQFNIFKFLSFLKPKAWGWDCDAGLIPTILDPSFWGLHPVSPPPPPVSSWVSRDWAALPFLLPRYAE